MTEPKIVKNPARYREMSVPHETSDALNAAIEQFQKDVEVSRVANRLPDVVVLILGRYVDDGGEEVQAFSQFSFGESQNVLPTVAHAYGRAKAEHDALLARLTTKAR